MKLSYPYKVWLTTIFASPVISMISLAVSQSASLQDFGKSTGFMVMMMIFGLGILLPSLWLYQLLYNEIRSRSTLMWSKLILASTGIFSIWLTFSLLYLAIFENADATFFLWPAIYSTVMFFSTFGFSIKREGNPEKNSQ